MSRVLFPIPAELSAWAASKSVLDENAGLFDESNNFVLWCNPDEYRPVTQAIGDARVIRSFGREVVATGEKIYGFDYDTETGRYTEYEFLLQLGKLAAANPASYKAITVIDYCLVEPENLATGYTVRSMRFSNAIQPRSGYYSGYGLGFSFQMMEIPVRHRY